MAAYYDIKIKDVRQLLKEKDLKGILIIVDGEHLRFKTAKTAFPVLTSIFGNPKHIFSNFDCNLVFDFDGVKW